MCQVVNSGRREYRPAFLERYEPARPENVTGSNWNQPPQVVDSEATTADVQMKF
jgi:hypothetical protein